MHWTMMLKKLRVKDENMKYVNLTNLLWNCSYLSKLVRIQDKSVAVQIRYEDILSAMGRSCEVCDIA